MLFTSLFLSALLLLAPNDVARRGHHPFTKVISFGAAMFLGLTGFIFPPLLFQAVLLLVAWAAWTWFGRERSSYFLSSCAATLIAYGLAACMAFGDEREYARLRALYPFVSMEAGVPTPRVHASARPKSTKGTLAHFQDGDEPVAVVSFRAHDLQRLHEGAVALFINSPGFGRIRMSRPTAWELALGEPGPPPLQPIARIESPWSPGELERLPASDEERLGNLVDENLGQFANPQRFGYVKDRKHVSGFWPHQFFKVPRTPKRWELQTLELVGLLVHDEPVVYVSDRLPQMSEHRDVPTRPLDDFESFGLKALIDGEDLFATRAGEGIRMLGALRSSNHCVGCHGGTRGDLLGAFSYTLGGGDFPGDRRPPGE